MEMNRRIAETHVLVLPLPFQGHINPMLQFSKRLASKEGETTNDVNELIQLYEVLFSKRLADFIEKNQTCSQHPAKVLVYDSEMPWAFDVAKRFGLQGASFFAKCCAVNAIFYHLNQGTFRVPLEEPVVS
ncbi:hypothetical protein DITRI_Ditri15bG0012200 [Diplodiscus trichospermus]